MPQINKIISKLEDHFDILDFLNKNYPDILKEWKLGSGPTNETQIPIQTEPTPNDQAQPKAINDWKSKNSSLN